MSLPDGNLAADLQIPLRQKALAALPNMVTILALWAGLSGLTYAMAGDSNRAIICVFIAALLDACDGRLARLTGTTSRFGAELDSLADVVCFGAVPAFILYTWGLDQFGTAGWLICLSLASACALRLARFNVAVEAPDKPMWAKVFFTGVPAPGGAFLGLMPVYMSNAGLLEQSQAVVMACFSVPLVASFMVSTVPTFSGKAMGRIAVFRWLIPSVVVTASLAGMAVVNPWLALCVMAVLYLATLPLSTWRHSLLQRRSAGGA